jgi:hypothetical protein
VTRGGSAGLTCKLGVVLALTAADCARRARDTSSPSAAASADAGPADSRSAALDAAADLAREGTPASSSDAPLEPGPEAAPAAWPDSSLSWVWHASASHRRLAIPPGLLRDASASARERLPRREPEYERVTTDAGCGLETLPASHVYQTCCNGEPCRGDCVRFKGQKKPVCYCASLVGGCPAPHHCCRMTHCGWVDNCLTH